MKFGELLNAYTGNTENEYFLLSLEGVEKDQTVSTNAFPLLDGIKEWRVPFFDIVDGKLWVRAEPDGLF